MKPNINTLGELKKSNYKSRSVKVELASNLAQKLKSKEPIFSGIYGYEDTVVPQLIHAILSGHTIVLLGEKGQAKTRLMRSVTEFLDEYIPILKGTDINESPFSPITYLGRKIVQESGDNTEISWLSREERYGERLAPGAKIGDIIGDIDPSKIINGEPMSSEGAIHFGLLPKSNLGIFAINEIPDLDYLVQVSLFNILEESDIQIRGISVRFPIDVFVCFTANPDDYSRSGKIITQLKDRIGSEIRTHYPKTRDIGLLISRQEVRLPITEPEVIVPSFIEEIIEEITVQARHSHLINQRSGVSARLSIANYEIAVSSARKRALYFHESIGIVRMTDLGNIFASSSGKIELDPYRDESISEFQVISKLIDASTRVIFEEYFPPKIFQSNFDEIAKQIYRIKKVEISDQMPSINYKDILNLIPSIWDLLHEKNFDKQENLIIPAIEFILEGLTSIQKLSRRRLGEISSYKTVEI